MMLFMFLLITTKIIEAYVFSPNKLEPFGRFTLLKAYRKTNN